MRLQRKAAIITGAAHGMGAEEVRLFAREDTEAEYALLFCPTRADPQNLASTTSGISVPAARMGYKVPNMMSWI